LKASYSFNPVNPSFYKRVFAGTYFKDPLGVVKFSLSINTTVASRSNSVIGFGGKKIPFSASTTIGLPLPGISTWSYSPVKNVFNYFIVASTSESLGASGNFANAQFVEVHQ